MWNITHTEDRDMSRRRWRNYTNVTWKRLACCIEETISILRNWLWPQTEKQGGDRIRNQCLRVVWKTHNSDNDVEGVGIGSMDGGPFTKGYVAHGQMKTPVTNEYPSSPLPFSWRYTTAWYMYFFWCILLLSNSSPLKKGFKFFRTQVD